MQNQDATTTAAPQPTQQKLMVWVPVPVHTAFRLLAVQRSATISDLIREALSEKYPEQMRAA